MYNEHLEDDFTISPAMERAWTQLSHWLFASGILSMLAVGASAFYYLASLITYYRLQQYSFLLSDADQSSLYAIFSFLGLVAVIAGVTGNVFLFKFSRTIRAALILKDQAELESAWIYLKKHYRVTGGLMIGYWVLIAVLLFVSNYFFRL
ncbi:MAG: hypothetical protein ACK5SQ_07870 [Chitinophagales bacterium]|jgi:hypothetical protein